MGVRERQQAVRAMRGQKHPPGRLPVARRDNRQKFWEAIARGLSSEDAGVAVGPYLVMGACPHGGASRRHKRQQQRYGVCLSVWQNQPNEVASDAVKCLWAHGIGPWWWAIRRGAHAAPRQSRSPR